MVVINFGGMSFGKMPIIKSCQHMSTTISDASTSQNTTIASVDTNNTILIYLGTTNTSRDATLNWSDLSCRLALTNSTTVTATRIGNTAPLDISYCVLEFYGGVIKSRQTGTISISDAVVYTNEVLTSIDTNKAMCLYEGHTNTDTTSDITYMGDVSPYLKIMTATLLRGVRGAQGQGATVIVGYQVVEFY